MSFFLDFRSDWKTSICTQIRPNRRRKIVLCTWRKSNPIYSLRLRQSVPWTLQVNHIWKQGISNLCKHVPNWELPWNILIRYKFQTPYYFLKSLSMEIRHELFQKIWIWMTEIQKIFRIQVRFCMKTLIWLTTTFFRSILTLMNQHGIRIVRSGHPNFWQGCRPRPSLLKSIQDTVFWAWKKITWKRSLRQFYRQRGKDLAFLWAYSIYFSNI